MNNETECAKRARALRVMLQRGVVKIVYRMRSGNKSAPMLSYATANTSFIHEKVLPEWAKDPSYDYIQDREEDGCVFFWDYNLCSWLNIPEDDIIKVSKEVCTSISGWHTCSHDYRWVSCFDISTPKSIKKVLYLGKTIDTAMEENSRGAIDTRTSMFSSDKANSMQLALESIIQDIQSTTDITTKMALIYKLYRSFFLPLQDGPRMTSIDQSTGARITMAQLIEEYITKELTADGEYI